MQFGAPIATLTPVAAMLADMKVSVEAARALLYETALIVDLKEGLEHRIEQLQAAQEAGSASPAGSPAATAPRPRPRSAPPSQPPSSRDCAPSSSA